MWFDLETLSKLTKDIKEKNLKIAISRSIMKISKNKKKPNLDYTNMIISAKFQVSILKTAPVMLRRNTAINT